MDKPNFILTDEATNLLQQVHDESCKLNKKQSLREPSEDEVIQFALDMMRRIHAHELIVGTQDHLHIFASQELRVMFQAQAEKFMAELRAALADGIEPGDLVMGLRAGDGYLSLMRRKYRDDQNKDADTDVMSDLVDPSVTGGVH